MTERFAVGHHEEDGQVRVARPWPVGRSAHPAGGITSTTPDLLRYARLHLDPPPELAPMQEPQADAEDEGEWVGLTWYGENQFGTIRHLGGTVGQSALLVVKPGTGFALAVLTNHQPNGIQVIDTALAAAGLMGPLPEAFSGAPVAEYAGAYETAMGRATITPSGERIGIEFEPFGGFPTKDTPPPPPPPPTEAFFYAPERWIIDRGPYEGTRGQFLRTETGEIAWLRLGGRLYKRV
jgi:hypothetical protein